MTQNNETAENTKAAPMTRDEVKKLLRDAAYVLHLTRRVKAEIMSDRAEAAKSGEQKKATEMPAGLGV